MEPRCTLQGRVQLQTSSKSFSVFREQRSRRTSTSTASFGWVTTLRFSKGDSANDEVPGKGTVVNVGWLKSESQFRPEDAPVRVHSHSRAGGSSPGPERALVYPAMIMMPNIPG